VTHRLRTEAPKIVHSNTEVPIEYTSWCGR